jgi:hypothetical protein
MRRANGQTVGEKEERVDELSGCVIDLTPRAELAEDASDNGVLGQESDAVVGEADDSSDPIEFITENGFSIVRPWESGTTPMPTGGKYHFAVSDGFIEREVTVEISHRVLTEISLRTRGRIEMSDSFWICCAEHHLADYLSEHEGCPEQNELIVESLDREDILLAIGWGRGDDES